MTEKFTEANDTMAKRLQLAMLNAIFTQLTDNPASVPASVLAVAERLLARYNVGLGWGVSAASGEMTAEEKAEQQELQAQFASLGLELDKGSFDEGTE